MPYNLQPASVAAGAVLPQSLATSFVDTHVYPILFTPYNDGTFERSLVQDGVNPPRALRTWMLAVPLTTAQYNALLTFFEQTTAGGLNPFYFYDPFDVLPNQEIGSNYDPTGDNTQGRATCFFRGDWTQQSAIARHAVPNLTMVEVA